VCGIAGVLSRDGSPVSPTIVRAMTDALTHRGPDEGGIRILPGDGGFPAPILGLGHRRLRVIDLTAAAAQPMSDAAGRGWLSYNGEIYNAQELRSSLQGRGVAFRSRSDTEVVLHALLAWGVEALERMNGMFALAFWDTRTRRLLLARDRFGEKPLYYADLGRRLLFASELGALPFHGGLPLEVDPGAVELYLTFGFIPAPWSIYRSVRKLPHASCLIAEPGRPVRVERYYRLEDRLVREAPPSPERTVLSAFDSAVRCRLEADVPLGAFLSGGIDSSAVVTLMRGRVRPPLRTYSMSVPELPYFDESSRARATSRRLGTEHHEIRVDSARMRSEIPAVLDALDEPFADSSALAASIIARAARGDLTVALSGDGGDEVFGGYRLYRALAAHRFLARLPRVARAALAGLLRSLPARHGGGASGLMQRGRKLLAGLAPELAAEHAAWMSFSSPAERRELCPGMGDDDLGRTLVEERYSRFMSPRGVQDPLDVTLAVEVDLPLPDDMLAKVDRMSMLHALEVRAPFLDPEVVELSLSLPAASHVSPFRGKRLLRRALRGVLPPRVLGGPKRGFEVPVGHWFAGPLKELYADVVSRLAMRSLPALQPAVAARWFEEHRRFRADRGRILWALFALCWWLRGPHARHLRSSQFLEESKSEVTVFRSSDG
jgi:asparagine synthase (glutamine-hydrolysing)